MNQGGEAGLSSSYQLGFFIKMKCLYLCKYTFPRPIHTKTHWRPFSLVHSVTLWLVCRFTHHFTHFLTHSFTLLLTFLLIHSSSYSLSYSFTRHLTHFLTHFTHSGAHLCLHSLISIVPHAYICSLVHSLPYPLTHSHSFTLLLWRWLSYSLTSTSFVLILTLHIS